MHADFSDQAHDAEVLSYFRDSGSPPPLTAFSYLSPTPPRATSPFADIRADGQQLPAASWVQSMRTTAASHRQLRSVSRQFAASVRRADVHSRASGRMLTNSQLAVDPFVELMRSASDNQRADADRHTLTTSRRECCGNRC